jgi:hypothetical protein
MSCFKNIYSSLFLCVTLLSSCTQNSNSLTPAEKGVGVGAVVGAGLGALVGAGAGEPGAGVVMGSIAGATGGGLIGSSMDNGDGMKAGKKRAKLASPSKLSAKSRSRTLLGSSSVGREQSFLGPMIWDRAPEDAREIELEDSSEIEIADNLPSGRKGIASKFSQIKGPQFKSQNELSDDVPIKKEKVSVSVGKARLSENIIDKPVIEMAKPVESGLPKARVASIASDQLLDEKKTTITKVKPELLTTKKQVPVLPAVKSKEAVVKKTIEIQPEKVTSEKLLVEKTLPKAVAKLPVAVEEEVKKVEDTESADVKLPEAKVEQKVDIQEKNAKLSNKPSVGAKCAKGESEIKRAMNSGSDSDKVFYLRRAILMCPEESSLRVELGKVYGRLGLKDDARREFTSAIDTDPANETAQEELSIMMLDGVKK